MMTVNALSSDERLLESLRGAIAKADRRLRELEGDFQRLRVEKAALRERVKRDSRFLKERFGESANGATSMKWRADTRLGGLIATIGQGLVSGTVEKTVNEFFNCIKQKLET